MLSIGSRVVRDDVPTSAGSSVDLCRALLAAISRLDGHEAGAILDRSLIMLGLGRTVDDVLLPSMREVGARWSRGQCDAQEERAATAAVRAWLAQCRPMAPPPSQDAPVVLACGPLDHHTLGLEVFEVMLAHARFACVNLGSQIQPDTLATTVDESRAQAVVLVSHSAGNRAAAVGALSRLERTGTALFYAGAAFRTRATRQRTPGQYLGCNFSRAVADVTAQLRYAVPR